MRKKQAGQVFIWVLMLLAVGSLVAVPTLRLTDTALKSSQIVDRQTKGLYAADAAQEYILWKLAYAGFGGEFEYDGQRIDYEFYVCDVPVGVSIVMRAKEGTGGMTLATDDKIRPTKTVDPSWVPDKDLYTYTYTINLDHLSDDTTVGLDAIFDVPPGNFGFGAYQVGTSQISLDEGQTWLDVPDPEWNAEKGYLKWPADYDWSSGTGAFSSDPDDTDHYFHGIRDFTPRQIKKLRFQMYGRLNDNQVHCNWVVLKPWNTVSGPQAPIDVGSPANPGVCAGGEVISISKTSDPEIISPGVETDITYTITLTNDYTETRFIENLVDYLPPEFEYIGPTSGSVTSDPQLSLENVNGVMRWKLLWTSSEFGGADLQIASGETLTITFLARATKDVSGSYYNEVFCVLKVSGVPQAFQEIGLDQTEYAQNYSWNTGTVIVPAYDSTSEAEGITINANMALILGGITITSWQVY